MGDRVCRLNGIVKRHCESLSVKVAGGVRHLELSHDSVEKAASLQSFDPDACVLRLVLQHQVHLLIGQTRRADVRHGNHGNCLAGGGRSRHLPGEIRDVREIQLRVELVVDMFRLGDEPGVRWRRRRRRCGVRRGKPRGIPLADPAREHRRNLVERCLGQSPLALRGCERGTESFAVACRDRSHLHLLLQVLANLRDGVLLLVLGASGIMRDLGGASNGRVGRRSLGGECGGGGEGGGGSEGVTGGRDRGSAAETGESCHRERGACGDANGRSAEL